MVSEKPTGTKASLLEHLNFLPVPAGTANLGLEDKVAERFVNAYGKVWGDFFCRETPFHQVSIDAFELARYPVTNALYAQFMAAGGYDNPLLWTPEGWAWRLASARTRPGFWGNPRFADDEQPVVGVSWYEAMAVARWVSLETGLNVRLPTEAEWEWAARGTNTRSLYPWGGAWDPDRLNSGFCDDTHKSQGKPVHVGSYSPAGDGPFGHADMLGQVWEWTSSAFKLYPYDPDDGREDLYAPEKRILRGGNWSDGKYANRVTTRYLYAPTYSDMTTGFRLAAGGNRPPAAARPAHDLVVYGRSTFCADLHLARPWLRAWNVPYRQVNIDLSDEAAARLDNWLGSRTVPTFVVAEYGSLDPITPPDAADLSRLRNTDRGSMLHEADEPTLYAFLVRNGFLR